MTIIKPKNKNQYLKFFFLTFLILVLTGIFYINQYNQLSNNRFQIEKMKKTLAEIQVKNVELKNELYKIIDPNKLNSLAQEKGLLMERQPQYFTLNH